MFKVNNKNTRTTSMTYLAQLSRNFHEKINVKFTSDIFYDRVAFERKFYKTFMMV